MQRRAFQLRIRPGKEAEYDRAHEAVWPELLAELDGFGVREYSIFRRGQELFLYLHVADFDGLMEKLSVSAVNLRWQERMAPLFESVPTLGAGERYAMMDEVFYMQGGGPAGAPFEGERADGQ